MDTLSIFRGRLHLNVSRGRLTLRKDEQIPLLCACYAGIALTTGEYLTTDGADCMYTDTGGLLVRQAGTLLRPELRWYFDVDASGAGLAIQVQVENSTSAPVAIERIDVLAAPSGYREAPIAQLVVAQTGWQSWSRATTPVPLEEAFSGSPPIAGPMLSDATAEQLLFPWMTLLRIAEDQSMLVGFISARDQEGVIMLQPANKGHRCVASSYPEGVLLQSGATLCSERLYMLFDQPDEVALDHYAQELATTMQACPWPQSITGWASWYSFFTGLSEQDVLRNLDALASQRHCIPLEYIRVDDAYQAEVGDWLVIKETFPRGMEFLAHAIHDAGFKAGIWIAPFLLSERSATYAAHPDWVVCDEQGTPINAMSNWGAPNYVLDTTHPEALAWLGRIISTILDDWGYDYLMIDFIFAAAVRGQRYEKNCTSIQAYRRGLQLIREIVGERYLLACGAPFAPSVGLVNSMRVDPDIALSWHDKGDQMNIIGTNPALLNAIRATLAHHWMHGRLWSNDPDCLSVRADHSELTLPEIETWATVIALSGGVVQVSDDIGHLDAERLHLLARLLPPSEQAAAPWGPTVDGIPTRASLKIERTGEKWLVAAFFNVSERAQEFVLDPVAWNMPNPADFHLFDLWKGEYLGLFTGPVHLPPTPAHGVKLLSVHTNHGRPQLVGSTFHLLGEAVGLAEERWFNGLLSIHLHCPGERTGILTIYVPQNYTYIADQRGAGTFDEAMRIVTLPIHLKGQTWLSLFFQQKSW